MVYCLNSATVNLLLDFNRRHMFSVHYHLHTHFALLCLYTVRQDLMHGAISSVMVPVHTVSSSVMVPVYTANSRFSELIIHDHFNKGASKQHIGSMLLTGPVSFVMTNTCHIVHCKSVQ